MSAETRLLSICNVDETVELYRAMLNSAAHSGESLAHLAGDDRSIRNLLQLSFDIDNALFFVLYFHNTPVGFIDSSRVIREKGIDEWYIKALFLLPEYRIITFFEQLVHRVEREAEALGLHIIRAAVYPPDMQNRLMWEGAGYQVEENKAWKYIGEKQNDEDA